MVTLIVTPDIIAKELLTTDITSKNEGFKFCIETIDPVEKFEVNVVPVLPYNTAVVPVKPLIPTRPLNG